MGTLRHGQQAEPWLGFCETSLRQMVIRALNKMTRAGIQRVYGLPKEVSDERMFYLNPIYSTNPLIALGVTT